MLSPVPRPREGNPYNPSRDREKVRGLLAFSLVGLLALLTVLLVVANISGWRTWDQLQGIATLTFGPLVSLTATMLGFYFGQKDS